MADNNLELPPGYAVHPDEHLDLPPGYSLSAPQKAQGFMQGLTTNQPTQGIGAYVGRNLPRAIGGAAGAMAGEGLASIPTAALGGASGEAARQALVSASGNTPPSRNGAGQTLGQIGQAAAEQGLGQGAVLGAGAAVNAVAPTILETFPRIAQKYAGAALDGASTGQGALTNAHPQEAVSAAYEAFERYTGLQGIQAQEVATQHLPSNTEMIQHIFSTGQKVVGGQAVDPQELYTASQYASRLKLMSRYANPPPEVLARSGAISQGKEIVDNALGDVFPEYKDLRNQQFLTKAKEAFSSALPLNRNQSVNKLGVQAAMGAAGAAVGAGELTGHPGAGFGAAALPLLAISPMAYGAAIQAAPLAAGALRQGAGQAGQSLYDYWQQLQAQKPQNPAPPLAPR